MAARQKVVLLLAIYFLGLSHVSGQSVVKMSMDQSQRGKSIEDTQKTDATRKSFSLAAYYTDNMVLQRAPKRAIIWGYALNIGERIIVKVSNRGIYTTKVYLDPFYNYGVWKVKLPAESSAGPFTITAISSEKTIQLKNVMFGDVWVCSGQSNMQFTVIQGFNATEEIADSNKYPDIRVFTVSDIPSAFPLPDLKGVLEKWFPASSLSVAGNPWTFFSDVCWLYGKALYKKLGYPIGLIDTTWGGTIVEAWSSHDALVKCGLENTPYETNYLDLQRLEEDGLNIEIGPNNPSYLWNGMVNPFLNMSIYGAIWYQGESNAVHNVHKYNCTFPTMIDDWRLKFHIGTEGETDPQFPFGFVQLSANSPSSTSPGFSEIRWHQTADYGYVPNNRMKNVFMSVTLDLPDFASPWGSIHPRDKQDVAQRLALSGLSVAYNKSGIVYQGPLPSQIVEGTKNISLVYTNKIKYNNLIGFEALCTVKNSSITFWTPLPIMSPLLNRIVMWSGVCGQGETIIGMRYLWSESPCAFKTCTVYSADNPLLPGPPFILYKTMTKTAGTVHKIDWNSPVAIAG